MRLSTLLLFSSTFLAAENFSSSLSSQGFTGLINTPNAQVIKEGNAVFQFNNQFDNNLRSYNYTTPYNFEENYIAGIGFFPYFEVIGRLVETPKYARDLSANVKFQIPYHHKYLPNIAIGAQDFGGVANFYDNTYIVIDKELGFLRASLGYGKASDKLVRGKRMDGIFGGAEAKVTDWFSVMAEHDGEENHAGLRLAVPDSLLSSVKLEATLAQNLTESQTHFAVNLTVPLFADYELPLHERSQTKSIYTHAKQNAKVYGTKNKPLTTVDSKQNSNLTEIQNKLVNFGFENVQVGTYEKSIYVKCENNIFDHTDLDALGYILGTMVTQKSTHKHYIITLLKNNLQTISMSGNVVDFENYVNQPTAAHKQALKANLAFSRSFDETKVHFISPKQNSSFFKPRLELSPGILTRVGTEIGVFDYLATLRANLYTNVYDGVTLSALYETPLVNSKNFDEHAYYANRHEDRIQSRLVNANLHQTTHYESLLNTLSIGQFETDYYGVMNQSNFTTTSGEHGFNLKVGTFKTKDQKSNKNRDNREERDIYLGSYRYYYEPLNLYTEVMYGQYWDQDRGPTLQFKRFFDQTSVAFYAKDVGYKYAGFIVSIPLTTRKSYNSKLAQIKGKKDFSYGLRTTLNEASGGNIQRPYGGIIPESDFEVVNHYLDRDRLNSSYISNNLERMREAYLSYKD
ncbi:YjbH domain-containing protein [bacterium]|nr:YjbH domain-containing protein [bacterium]MBU1957258.1 YjbH domain-containing protein [bacterium]